MPANNQYQIINKTMLWEGKFIRALLLEYVDNKCGVRVWEAVERVNCGGIVAIIPLTADGNLLMIRQFRPVLNRHVIEFPAGLNDKGESLVDTAKRELIEETGYTSDSFEFVAEGPISSGLSTEVLTVYIARNAVPASAELKTRYPMEETESIELIEVPPDSACGIIESYRKNGDLADIKIYGFIEMLRNKKTQ